jgi:hypothetical protein
LPVDPHRVEAGGLGRGVIVEEALGDVEDRPGLDLELLGDMGEQAGSGLYDPMSSAVYTASNSIPSFRLEQAKPARSTLERTIRRCVLARSRKAPAESGKAGQAGTDEPKARSSASQLFRPSVAASRRWTSTSRSEYLIAGFAASCSVSIRANSARTSARVGTEWPASRGCSAAQIPDSQSINVP